MENYKRIFKLIARIIKKIKTQPFYIILLLLEALIVIIYFPKYLYLRATQQKIICIDWQDGVYKDFFLPLFEEINKIGLKVVFFFNIGYSNNIGLDILIKGLPRSYANLLDNKIILCATSSKYKKLNNTIRVQIFHGLSSFGGGWQRNFIDNFDVLFLVTKFQWYQCYRKYKELVKDKKIYKIGYPKIDKYISIQKGGISNKNITIFYGPTYHQEISSIFEFLPTIIQICNGNDYKLIIKLHPFLYHRYNYEYSGGINWTKKISRYQKKYKNIIFLAENKSNIHIAKYFQMADIFLTDVSGIGFEFVLATGKPIIFLGAKLKIPLEDLRNGNTKKYEDYPEVFYRGRIGPVVKHPMHLRKTMQKINKEGCSKHYKTAIENFRRNYIFNLGNATDAAISEISKLYYKDLVR
jgi:hypothetical protein